jgi:hypothetical protein
MMERECSCGSGLYGAPVTDGYGIFLFYACAECYKQKIKYYRSDIMEQYACDEPIEEE